MGLITKMNRKATWTTVVRRGVVTSIIGTSLYFSILWWNGWWSELPFKLGICASLLLFVGGLFEWQVPEDDWDFPKHEDTKTDTVQTHDTLDSSQNRR